MKIKEKEKEKKKKRDKYLDFAKISYRTWKILVITYD